MTKVEDLVHKTDSPFSMNIITYQLLSLFKFSQLKNFDGIKDPIDLLETYKTIMNLKRFWTR